MAEDPNSYYSDYGKKVGESIKSPQRKTIMQSDLDMQLLTTESGWGKDLTPELKEKIIRKVGYYVPKIVKDEKGKEHILVDNTGKPVMELVTEDQQLWSLLGFYTRDMRLANLSKWDGEINYCTYYLDLANDFLQAEMVEPFLICLSRVATVLELSQSKGGFLRRRMNTFSQEHINVDTEPARKNLFGKSGNSQGGN